MADPKLAREMALEILRAPPPVTSKLLALDALERLSLNPSGWLSEATLDRLFEVRKAVLQDRWQRALEVLEDTRQALETFFTTLDAAAKQDQHPAKADAAERARQEHQQLVRVLAWLDQRPQR
jgi:hypothetical protein